MNEESFRRRQGWRRQVGAHWEQWWGSWSRGGVKVEECMGDEGRGEELDLEGQRTS